MLTELYRYALDKGLAAQPGFKPKRVKAYVLLSASGEFLGIHTREKDAPAVYAPDIGAADFGMLFLGGGPWGCLPVHLAPGLAGAAGGGRALYRHGHLPRRASAGSILLRPGRRRFLPHHTYFLRPCIPRG